MRQNSSKSIALFPVKKYTNLNSHVEYGLGNTTYRKLSIQPNFLAVLPRLKRSAQKSGRKYIIIKLKRPFAVLFLLAFVSIFQTSCGHVSENRNHKTSNTVKSATAIETPAVSEELENISKIKWDTGNSSTTEKLLAYLHHGQENDVQYAGAEALALRADPRVYSTLRKVYSKLRSGRRGFNVKNEKWR
jgi:hypothetical protein